MHLSETELFLRANDCQENLATRIIIEFVRDPGLILSELEHWRGIEAIYVVLIGGVVLDEKIPKLKYYRPVSVEKWEGIYREI